VVARNLILPLLILLAVISGLSNARADDATAKAEFMAGYSELEQGNFRKALQHYQSSYEASPRPRTLYNIAVCEEELGRTKDAIEHYQQFLRIAQARDAQFLTDARERLEGLQALISGEVKILSEPPGATVSVDGKKRGHTPLALQLSKGQHMLSLSHRFARGSERRIEVAAGESSTEKFQLDPVGHVRIQVQPDDAVIRRMDVDEVSIGNFESALSPGTYRFELSVVGFFPKTLTLNVHAGTTTDRSIRLERQSSTAMLQLISDEAGANVSVDGLIVGSTRIHEFESPSLEKRVTTGNHTVTVETRDGATWRKRMHFSPGETLSLQIDFRGQTRNRRLASKGLKGVGLGMVAIGLVYGVMAVSDVRSADEAERSRGRDRATNADIFLALGGLSYLGGWYVGKRAPNATVERSHEQERQF
jgi:hypothetical protein